MLYHTIMKLYQIFVQLLMIAGVSSLQPGRGDKITYKLAPLSIFDDLPNCVSGVPHVDTPWDGGKDSEEK